MIMSVVEQSPSSWEIPLAHKTLGRAGGKCPKNHCNPPYTHISHHNVFLPSPFFSYSSILGMHLFGCKFSLKTDTGDTVPDRKNFDSLLWAIVTVFQVSSGSFGKI